MCGRYYLEREQSKPELEEILERLNRRGLSYKTGEIFPTDLVPVIANSKAMQPAPFVMQWGYSLSDGKRIINARSESAAANPMFRDGMQQRRCLIPADHYFEWAHHAAEKTKYAIRPIQADVMYLAGIYRLEPTGPVFTILTRAPSQQISFIHDRMPVIFSADLAKDWINVRYAPHELLLHAVGEVAAVPV